MPESCTHHWQIAVAAGPTSLGDCRYCEGERVFQNSTRDKDYNGRSWKEWVLPKKKTVL